MNARRLACLFVASLFMGAAVLVPLPSADGPDGPRPEARPTLAPRPAGGPLERRPAIQPHGLRPAAERARIREHLRGAERILRAADVSHLTDAQRERRARTIELLREYRQAGVFPHNHDFPGERVPYFVDRHGTLCAMAYVIAHAGGEELVERVARTANNARVPELAGDPAFDEWLDRHGMTAAEATRVQPTYDWYPRSVEPEVDASYALASAGNAALTGAAIALQLTDDGEADAWRNILGLAAGGVGIGMGAVRLGTPGDEKLAALNVGLGAAALGTVAWRLFRGDDAAAPVVGGGDGPRAEPGSALSWSARPALSGRDGAGVHVTLRF